MLLLWILSLAASFLLSANGEVVRNFGTCSQFFLHGKFPKSSLRPMNPARICQYYRDKYRFATMYNRDRRIPMFSAYKYQPGGAGRENKWMVELQLALRKEHKQKSMELESRKTVDQKLLAESQAISKDYEQLIKYDRGHLLPVAHQSDLDSKVATFTLTNIVPQFRQLSQGKWAEYEKNMKRNITDCRDTYVIVGVVPGESIYPVISGLQLVVCLKAIAEDPGLSLQKMIRTRYTNVPWHSWKCDLVNITGRRKLIFSIMFVIQGILRRMSSQNKYNQGTTLAAYFYNILNEYG